MHKLVFSSADYLIMIPKFCHYPIKRWQELYIFTFLPRKKIVHRGFFIFQTFVFGLCRAIIKLRKKNKAKPYIFDEKNLKENRIFWFFYDNKCIFLHENYIFFRLFSRISFERYISKILFYLNPYILFFLKKKRWRGN